MDDQLVGVKANRLKDNNDLEEWKTERQKFESSSPASERAVMCCGRAEMKATDSPPPEHVQELDVQLAITVTGPKQNHIQDALK